MEVDLEHLEHPARAKDNAGAPPPPPLPPSSSSSSSSSSCPRRARTAALSRAQTSPSATPRSPASPRRRPKLRPRQAGLGQPAMPARGGARPGVSALAWVLSGALLWRGGVSATATTRVVTGKANSVALVNAALGGGGLGGGGGLPWACEAGAGKGGAPVARSPARLRHTNKLREHGKRSWEQWERRERPGRGGDGPGEEEARGGSREERRHHRSPTKWAGDLCQPREVGTESGRGRSLSTPASLTPGGSFEGGARASPANPVIRGNLPLAREQQLQVAVAETGAAAAAAAVVVAGVGGGVVGPAARADVGGVNGKSNPPAVAIAAAGGQGQASSAAKGSGRRPRERASGGGKGEGKTRLSGTSSGGGGGGGSGGGGGGNGNGGRSSEARGTDSVRMRRFLPGARGGEHAAVAAAAGGATGAAAGAAATGEERRPPRQQRDKAKNGNPSTPQSAAKQTVGGRGGRRLRVRGEGAGGGGSSKGKANSATSPKFPKGGAAAAAAAATAARLSGAAAAREIVRESERAARAKDSAAESKMESSDDEVRDLVLSSTIPRRCPPAVGFVSGFREISASDAAAAAAAAVGKGGGVSCVGGVDALIRVLSEPPEPSPRQVAPPSAQRAYSSTRGDARSSAVSKTKREDGGSGVRSGAGTGGAAVGGKGDNSGGGADNGKGEGVVVLPLPAGQRANADVEPASSRKAQKGKPHPDARSAYPGVAQSATELNYKALDPPSRSVSINFNPEASSLLSCVTTSSDVYGDALHDSKAPGMSRAATAAYLERWVLIAVKHGVLPRELRALLQDGEPDSLDFYGRSKRGGGADGGRTGEGYGARAGPSSGRAAGGVAGAGAGDTGSPEAAVSWTKYGWNRLDASRPPSPPLPPPSVSSSSSVGAAGAGGATVTASPRAGSAFSFGKPPAARSAAAGEGRAAGPPSSDPSLVQDAAAAAAAAAAAVGVKNGRGNQRQQGGQGEVEPEGEEAGRDEEAEEEEEMENVAEALVGGEREEDAPDWNPGSSSSSLSSLPRPAQQPAPPFGGSAAGRGDARDRRRPADGGQNSGAVGAAGARGGGWRAEGSDLSLGWRVLEAVEARFASRLHPPRIIAIGDVHGCLDELKDLVRKVEYWPGDLLLFLGDLVAKGPNSSGVVRLARELGGVSVRGNHEFEVLRWLNVGESEDGRPPSRHHKIAMALSEEDGAWLKASPWFFRCDDLDSLFVHAGFVPGVGMRRQNPRMMMNMRSVSDEGVPTSKVLETRPWARQWRGPPTVFFGHDADRGLQVLDHAMGLDTGCVYGGRLTACILPDRRLVSVASKAAYIEYRRRGWARDVANAPRVSSSSGGGGGGGGKGRNGKNGNNNNNGRH